MVIRCWRMVRLWLTSVVVWRLSGLRVDVNTLTNYEPEIDVHPFNIARTFSCEYTFSFIRSLLMLSLNCVYSTSCVYYSVSIACDCFVGRVIFLRFNICSQS